MINPGIYRGREANQVIRIMQKAVIEDFEREVSKYSCTSQFAYANKKFIFSFVACRFVSQCKNRLVSIK